MSKTEHQILEIIAEKYDVRLLEPFNGFQVINAHPWLFFIDRERGELGIANCEKEYDTQWSSLNDPQFMDKIDRLLSGPEVKRNNDWTEDPITYEQWKT